MSFIIHEDELWPVALIVVSGYYSLRQHVESLKQWNKWLAREETFYVIRVFLNAEATQSTEEIGESTINWMQNGAANKIKQRVGAMLFVAPETHYDNNQTIEKVFGVPGGIFPSVSTAYSYLQTVPNFSQVISDNTVTVSDIEKIIEQCIASTSKNKKTLKNLHK